MTRETFEKSASLLDAIRDCEHAISIIENDDYSFLRSVGMRDSRLEFENLNSFIEREILVTLNDKLTELKKEFDNI